LKYRLLFGVLIPTCIKRETGEIPVRSRRCKRGVPAVIHWVTGKDAGVMMLEPEDLPVLLHHNSTSDRGCC